MTVKEKKCLIGGKVTGQNILTLRTLARQDDRCINCRSFNPDFICWDFLTFVCQECADVHRSFGHQIAAVQHHEWTAAEYEKVEAGGNQKAAAEYLAFWNSSDFPRPDNKEKERLRDFIRKAYVIKCWQKQPDSKSLRKLARQAQKNGAAEASTAALPPASLPSVPAPAPAASPAQSTPSPEAAAADAEAAKNVIRVSRPPNVAMGSADVTPPEAVVFLPKEAAVYCPAHDCSEKRPKTEPRLLPCRSCGLVLMTNYQQFTNCPSCSARLNLCMICGSSATPLAPAAPLASEPTSLSLPTAAWSLMDFDFGKAPPSDLKAPPSDWLGEEVTQEAPQPPAKLAEEPARQAEDEGNWAGFDDEPAPPTRASTEHLADLMDFMSQPATSPEPAEPPSDAAQQPAEPTSEVPAIAADEAPAAATLQLPAATEPSAAEPLASNESAAPAAAAVEPGTAAAAETAAPAAVAAWAPEWLTAEQAVPAAAAAAAEAASLPSAAPAAVPAAAEWAPEWLTSQQAPPSLPVQHSVDDWLGEELVSVAAPAPMPEKKAPEEAPAVQEVKVEVQAEPLKSEDPFKDVAAGLPLPALSGLRQESMDLTCQFGDILQLLEPSGSQTWTTPQRAAPSPVSACPSPKMLHFNDVLSALHSGGTTPTVVRQQRKSTSAFDALDVVEEDSCAAEQKKGPGEFGDLLAAFHMKSPIAGFNDKLMH